MPTELWRPVEELHLADLKRYRAPVNVSALCQCSGAALRRLRVVSGTHAGLSKATGSPHQHPFQAQVPRAASPLDGGYAGALRVPSRYRGSRLLAVLH
eukprot:scaffold138241_cov145-Phaeocystis_antarctica.AAC.1